MFICVVFESWGVGRWKAPNSNVRAGEVHKACSTKELEKQLGREVRCSSQGRAVL